MLLWDIKRLRGVFLGGEGGGGEQAKGMDLFLNVLPTMSERSDWKPAWIVVVHRGDYVLVCHQDYAKTNNAFFFFLYKASAKKEPIQSVAQIQMKEQIQELFLPLKL